MNLATAGMISGAGKAGTNALAMAQNYVQSSALLDEREKWEDARSARNLASQERMHSETLSANAQQHASDRESADLRAEREISSREKEGTLTRGSAEKLHGMDEKSRELIAREGTDAQKQIHADINSTNLKIAELKNKLDGRSLKASELTAVQHYIDSLSDDIRGVELKLLDPLADPTSPVGKALMGDLKHKKGLLARAEAQFDLRVTEMQKNDHIAPAPSSSAEPVRPPIKQPSFDRPSSSIPIVPEKRNGILSVPSPSDQLQESMRNAADELKRSRSK